MKNAYKEFDHDVEPFITDYVRAVLEEEREFNKDYEKTLFKETFKLVEPALGEDAWRYYKNGKHMGAFSVYVYEAVSIGISSNIDFIRSLSKDDLKNRVINFKQEPNFLENTGPGANVKLKLHRRIESAKSFFEE